MRKWMFLFAAAGLVAAGLAAQEAEPAAAPSTRSGIVIGKAEKQLTLWTRNGREVFQYNAETIMPQRKLKDGNLVWVRTTGPGSKVAARIVIVDEQISVVGRLGREHAVIGNTWESRSPSQLIVRNKAGQEMFVIDPKTFRQPMPKPGERVAVTYRVENVRPPRYIATGLVILPPNLEEESPVKVTYSEVPQPPVQVAEVAEPAPAPAPEPEPVLAELPQTARQTPAVLAAGLLLMILGGWALRSRLA